MVALTTIAASAATTLLGIAYWASPIVILIGLPLFFGRSSSARWQLLVGAALGAAMAFAAIAAWFESQSGNFVESMSPLKTWLTTVAGGLLGIACVAGARGILNRLTRPCS